MITLPAAEWTKREDLAQLVAALGSGNVRWVGGAVRDTLLDHPVADVDAATSLHPDEVTKRLRDAGIRVIPTGIDHGTVTAILPDGNVEVTTLRKDISTDGRRATVAYATEWQDDAARRDFTMNALYADPATLEVFDYFNGVQDLENRQVRFIGDARERIREDHLRILRYYRFTARFGCNLVDEAEEACAELAPTLKGLSRERVAMELLGILSIDDPTRTVTRMFNKGVLPVVLPECGEEQILAFERLVQAEFDARTGPDPVRRLASLIPPSTKMAEQVASRLRLSNAQKKRLVSAAGRSAEPGDPRALAYAIGRDQAVDRLLLAGDDIGPVQDWSVPEFPLKGGEIVARGLTAGPQIARMLRALEARWVEEDFPGRERVLEMLDEQLKAE